jgi:hypothetical protein
MLTSTTLIRVRFLAFHAQLDLTARMMARSYLTTARKATTVQWVRARSHAQLVTTMITQIWLHNLTVRFARPGNIALRDPRMQLQNVMPVISVFRAPLSQETRISIPRQTSENAGKDITARKAPPMKCLALWVLLQIRKGMMLFRIASIVQRPSIIL